MMTKVDLGVHADRGFTPLGLNTMICRSHVFNNRNTIRQNQRLFAYGCVQTQSRLIKSADKVREFVGLCPTTNGETVVSALTTTDQSLKNLRGSYIIGDFEDLVRVYCDTVNCTGILSAGRPGLESLCWVDVQDSHPWVPYLDIDIKQPFRSKTHGIAVLWPHVEKGINVVKAMLTPMIAEPLIGVCMETTILFGHRPVGDDGKFKYSFHVHFHNLGIDTISAWKDLVTRANIRIPDYDSDGIEEKGEGQLLFDTACYAKNQIFRGPYVPKTGDLNEILLPFDLTSDAGKYKWKVRAGVDHVVVGRCAIRAPPSRLQYVIRGVSEYVQRETVAAVLQVNEQQPVSLTSNPWWKFWRPLVVNVLLPKWQMFRRARAAELGARNYNIPVSSLDYSIVDVAADKPYRITMCVVGDTFCETDRPNHHHSRSTTHTRVVINLLECTMAQSCRACGCSGEFINFMGYDGEFSIDNMVQFKVLAPVGKYYAQFLLSYFSDNFVTELGTGIRWVYDKETKLWQRVSRSSIPLLLTYAIDLNKLYRVYIRSRVSVMEQQLLRNNPSESAIQKVKRDSATFLRSHNYLVDVTGPITTVGWEQIAQYPASNVVVTEMDCYANYIPMNDGQVMDVFTGECFNIRANMYLTSMCNAKLSQDMSQLEEIKEWFNEIACGDQELVWYLRMVAAYCMTMLIHNRQFYVLFGNGCNGKGQFKSFLDRILKLTHQTGKTDRVATTPPGFWFTSTNSNAVPLSVYS